MLLYRPSYCRFLCSSFRFQHLSHFVGCGFRGTLLEKAGLHKNRVPYADFRHAVGGCGAFHAVFDMLFFIGQSSTEGERKRRARMKISEQKRLSGQVSEAKADICPPEIEIKKEIDIEIEKERELKPGRAAPAAYGRYKNVILTDTELSELKAELPDKWEYYIDRLSGYIASTGRKYKDHAATIRRWAADDTAKAAPKKGIPDYSYKEGESL